MNKELEHILKQVLTPGHTPDDLLNRRIFNQVKETNYMKRRKFTAAAAVAAILATTSLTVFAAYHFWTPSDIANKLGDDKLSANFAENTMTEQEETQYETQVHGNYQVSFLGMLTGENLSEFESRVNGELRNDKAYVAVAIQKTDESPVTENEEFFVTPLIGNLNPATYNAASLFGGYSQFIEDGILYRLAECENIEYFADQNLYLAVMDSAFYSAEYYHWDEINGSITRNEDATGFNALFPLTIDRSKADPVKAQAILDSLFEDNGEEEINLPLETEDALAWAAALTAENIEQYCVRMESTVETVTPDGNGQVSFSPWFLIKDGEGSTYSDAIAADSVLSYYFPDKTPGLIISGYSCSDGMVDLVITTYTLHEDGSITSAAYVPKEVSQFLSEN